MPFWSPSPESVAASQMRAFFARVRAVHPSAPVIDAPYADWHSWSVREPELFWSALWEFGGVIGEGRVESVLRAKKPMDPWDSHDGPRWFEGARLNFAENLLRRRDDAPALIWRGEDGARREVSFAELFDGAMRVAAALQQSGVNAGDRVAAYMPNVPETVIAMLGVAWIGATWSSCSPDFGVQGVLDRFGQIEPKVLIVADGYRYAGKEIDLLPRVAEIADQLPTVRQVVVVPQLRNEQWVVSRCKSVVGQRATAWGEWIRDRVPVPGTRYPFSHPLYILYSSGTTGLPKCIVHGAGGTLLQHLKEHLLHVDLRRDERIFYFTTCGWMMWNWVVSALAVGATVVLYDGAPMPAHNPNVLWDLASQERVNVFGTSAKYVALCEKSGLTPRTTHDLGALRSLLSTGSPLAPASFDYLARDVKPGVHVGSISGGTDIVSCFALGNPLLPVHRGELQAPGLGMAVDVFDGNGASLRGSPGELVCTKPFPCMPVAFWDDRDGAKYRAAYFDFFPGVWRHGDWAEITEHGGLIIHGRSDATLNPGGVRIGTAEIYRQVEQFDEVVECVVIGQAIGNARDDVRVVLFVRLRDGSVLNDELVASIKKRVRDGTSPHHVPKLVLQVRDIPRTVSGKIAELAVREAFEGREVKNTAAMANPAALDEYRQLGALHRD
ncbi:MAG TPA: acetoacetate--CoA ligase [Gemmatimonadaceae bacterium]|nr:acetoacetate--CoA ligase [Gemmatimonadaceae bacterium]